MKPIAITEFRAQCVRLLEEVHRTGDPIAVTKRGKTIAVVSPPSRASVDWTPGAFRVQTKILGDIMIDLTDLGLEFEAMVV